MADNSEAQRFECGLRKKQSTAHKKKALKIVRFQPCCVIWYVLINFHLSSTNDQRFQLSKTYVSFLYLQQIIIKYYFDVTEFCHLFPSMG